MSDKNHWIPGPNGESIPAKNPHELMLQEITFDTILQEFRNPTLEYQGWDIWCNSGTEVLSLYNPNRLQDVEEIREIVDKPDTGKVLVFAHPGLSNEAVRTALNSIADNVTGGLRISQRIGKETRLQMVEAHGGKE